MNFYSNKRIAAEIKYANIIRNFRNKGNADEKRNFRINRKIKEIIKKFQELKVKIWILK